MSKQSPTEPEYENDPHFPNRPRLLSDILEIPMSESAIPEEYSRRRQASSRLPDVTVSNISQARSDQAVGSMGIAGPATFVQHNPTQQIPTGPRSQTPGPHSHPPQPPTSYDRTEQQNRGVQNLGGQQNIRFPQNTNAPTGHARAPEGDPGLGGRQGSQLAYRTNRPASLNLAHTGSHSFQNFSGQQSSTFPLHTNPSASLNRTYQGSPGLQNFGERQKPTSVQVTNQPPLTPSTPTMLDNTNNSESGRSVTGSEGGINVSSGFLRTENILSQQDSAAHQTTTNQAAIHQPSMHIGGGLNRPRSLPSSPAPPGGPTSQSTFPRKVFSSSHLSQDVRSNLPARPRTPFSAHPRSRNSSRAPSRQSSPGVNTRHPSRASVKHLTCYWWQNKGYCKFKEEDCLYSHSYTGLAADAPRQVKPGEPAKAGRHLEEALKDLEPPQTKSRPTSPAMPHFEESPDCLEARVAQSVLTMCDDMKRALDSFAPGEDIGVSAILIRRIDDTVVRLNQELTEAAPVNMGVRALGQYMENASADLAPAVARAANAVQLIRHDFWGLQRRVNILEENERVLEGHLQRAEEANLVLQATCDELKKANEELKAGMDKPDEKREG